MAARIACAHPIRAQPPRGMSTVLLCTLGSAGDVHPVIAVAQSLKKQGHRPIVVTTDIFAPSCHRLGLEFEPLLPASFFQGAMGNPDLWHPWRSFGVLARDVIVPSMRPLYDRIADWQRRTDDLVVASSLLCFGARLAQEKLGVPTASLHVQPVVLRSRADRVGTPHFRYPRTGARWRKSLVFRMADRFIVDRTVLPGLNRFRAELGLPRVKRVLEKWIHSPELVVGLWPEWYAPLQPDWPDNVVLTDFPLFDPEQEDPLPPRVEQFLRAGESPVLFTAGSANLHTQQLFSMAARVCARLGVRGLMVGPEAPSREALAVADCMHSIFLPFGSLLPRCRAIVHHGGIGTVARALQNELPQVIIPLSHDQPDNAMRVRHLGLGDFVPASRLTQEKLERALAEQLALGPRSHPRRDVGALSGPDAAAQAITRIARTARV